MADCVATSLHDFAELTPSLLAVWDRDLRCRYANPAYKTWFGVDPEKLPGTTLDDLLGPVLFAQNEQFVQGALHGAAQVFERDIPGPDKVRHSLARYIPEVKGGEVVGFMVEVTDVSLLKRSQHSMMSRVADLEQQIIYYQHVFSKRGYAMRPSEEHVQLHQAALKQATTLAAQIAHELRNSLTPICAGMDVLNLGEPSASNSARTRQMIVRQLSQMGRLIDDLIDCAGIELGALSLRKERISAVELFESAIAGCSSFVEAAGQRLSADIDVDAILYCDPTRITQAISNLIVNASKYSPTGTRIDVKSSIPIAGTLQLSVIDQGAGMPPDAAARLFKYGGQLEHTLSRARGGIGIGLMLVRQIIYQHGGEVQASSAGVGRGSTFSFTLPVA